MADFLLGTGHDFRNRSGDRWNFIPTTLEEPKDFEEDLAPRDRRYRVYVEGQDLQRKITVERPLRLNFQASAELKLHAIGSGPYKGILIWNDGKGSNPTSQIFLGGQIQLDVAGTIYSPKGYVKIDGGSGVGSSAAIQVIAWQFDVGGNSVLDMPYDPAALYHIDYKGLVY